MASPDAHVVIVGAGFAGLNAAKTLGNQPGVKVTLIDRRNYHLFQPLLYQVATAGLSPAEIAYPIRSILSKFENIQVLLGNVTAINLSDRRVTTDAGEWTYDHLVLACGAKHSYFGNEQWEEQAPGLKTLEQATEIRRRIFLAFENAEIELDKEKQRQWLTFVIVGGGPTGVELAGAIGEISRYTLARDFRKIDPARTRVILIEAGSRVLSAMDPRLSSRAERDLEGLGVQLWLNSRVTNISSDGVSLGNESIRAKTVLWAAGVQPSSLNKALGVKLDSLGRVRVESDLTLSEHPEVFVLGDQACALNADQKPLPGLAPVAMQQGRYAGQKILKKIRGASDGVPFVYVDKGMMATIGRKKAVGQTTKARFSGWLAWIAWLLVHVYYLIGFKNRLLVLFQWAWSYLTFSRGARLIIDKEWRSIPKSRPL